MKKKLLTNSFPKKKIQFQRKNFKTQKRTDFGQFQLPEN
jgi:hypothetical protein